MPGGQIFTNLTPAVARSTDPITDGVARWIDMIKKPLLDHRARVLLGGAG